MLLGRVAECERIDRLLDAARTGHGGALLLRGPPGIGKTALMEHARRRAVGLRVLTAAGYESEAELPFAGLATLVRPLLDDLASLPELQRSALEGALAIAPSVPRDRFSISLATLSLLTQAGDRAPLLCLVDDVHWLDRPSLDALLFASRRLAGDPVAVLLAVREGEGPDTEAHGLPELRLEGLGRQDCEELLRQVSTAPVRPDTVDRLVRATGGNPLALIELSTVATDAAAGGWLDEPLPVGPRIRRALWGRIEALPAPTRRALGAAAASDTGSMAEIAGVLRRLGLERRDLDPAEVAGLVRLDGSRLVFAHPLLRAVAYRGMSAPERRIAHMAYGEVLAGDPSVTRRAWHLAATVVEPDDEVAATLEEAGEEARRRAAPAAAGTALAAAARLTPDRRARVARLRAAAQELHLAGRPQEALRVLDDALADVADPATHAGIVHLRMRVGLLSGPCLQTRERLVREAESIASLDAACAAAMLADASMVSVMAGRPRAALALARRAHCLASGGADDLRLITAYGLGIGLLLRGAASLAAGYLSVGDQLTNPRDLLATGYHAIHAAQSHTWREAHHRASALLSDLVAEARRESALDLLPYALAALAEAQWHVGEWNSAYANASESVDLAVEIGQPNELSHSLVRLAHVEAGQGREADCREHLRRARELAERLDVGSVATLAGTSLGLLECSLGRAAEVISALEPTGRAALRCGLREPRVAMWSADLAEAYARVGRTEEARSTLRPLQRHGMAAGRASELGAVARVHGVLAERDRFDDPFERSLECFEASGLPFERARTQLCFGERLAAERRLADARAHILDALGVFRRLSASTWEARASAALTASGGRARFQRDPTGELTAHELQVAMLVAQGATNREAAAALFVSPKTIEVHLTRIYRKLGVRSRTELARRLAGPGAAGSGSAAEGGAGSPGAGSGAA